MTSHWRARSGCTSPNVKSVSFFLFQQVETKYQMSLPKQTELQGECQGEVRLVMVVLSRELPVLFLKF